jgi:hypothetical protein
MTDRQMPIKQSILSSRRLVPAILVCAMVAVAPGLAQGISDPRGIAVGEINEAPPFLVRVEVNHPDRVYHEGDAIQVSVRSERAGHLYLFYCDAGRQVTCLFPNKVQSDNDIPANETVRIPDASARFRLRVAPPFGNEVLKAVVTSEPLKALELDTLTKGHFTPVEPDQLKAVVVEVQGDEAGDSGSENTETRRPAARPWAEHYVKIVTRGAVEDVAESPGLADISRFEDFVGPAGETGLEMPPAQPDSSAGPNRQKRVGVFIGVSNYQDPSIRPLKVAHHDAAAFAEVMSQYGRLDETILLTNEKATLRNIQRAIRGSLAAATGPGDLVIIYWSGHGGRTSNLDGTEPDGYDEYLVPYDGRLEPADAIRQTMLLDKTFGRWVQELDGRKLLVIIDACHSGGQTQDAVKALTGGDAATPFRKFFFATLWTRTKDIGQRETAVLASSRATQISFERRGGDLSVMTHFLIEKLTESAGPVTLLDAVEHLQAQVPAFVEKHYPGTTQTPVFVDQTTPPVYLRP